MTEYNGHPSYDHWSVALWVGNDEGLYGIARGYSREVFPSLLMSMMPFTPDGVENTEELSAYAWDCVNE